jgi:DNA polymerase III subunit delta
MSFQSFINEIHKSLPSPVYLFYASDPFLHREALAAIRELVPVSERDFNFHVFDLLAQGEENLTLERILDVVNTVSFFGGRRFTVLMGNVQKFLKKDIEKLQVYASKPAQDSVFVILHYGEMKKEAREKFKVFKPVSIDIRESEIPQWIKQRVRTKGIDFSDEAVEYLISLVGNDLGLLSAEIEKISFVGQKRIDVDDISDLVAGRRQYGIFDLVNALKAQDADSVFRIYKSLKETSDDYGLIGALNWQYARFSQKKMSRQEEEYQLNVFELLNQADIEIKSSGRSFPMEYLLIKLLRLQGLHSPSV